MDDWIRPEEQAPTERDVDAQGCVLVWHKYNGCMLMNWHLAWNNPYVLAWMHAPKRPEWLKDEKKGIKKCRVAVTAALRRVEILLVRLNLHLHYTTE